MENSDHPRNQSESIHKFAFISDLFTQKNVINNVTICLHFADMVFAINDRYLLLVFLANTIHTLTNKEASTVLCSAVEHTGSGRARKKCRGKHETQS